MMDSSVTAFIHAKQKFSLQLLVQAFSRLCLIQLNQGHLTFDDVVQCVQFAAPQCPADICHAHASLICEGSIVSSASTGANPLTILKIPPHILGNEGNFIRSLLDVMYLHSEGISSNSIDLFQAEAMAFLKQVSSNQQQNQPQPRFELPMRSYHRASPEFVGQGPLSDQQRPSNREYHNFNAPSHNSYQVPPRSSYAPSNNPNHFSNNRQNFIPRNNFQQYQHPHQSMMNPSMMSDYDLERSDAVSRLLAQVRKNGMDILFPQLTQDMILATILISVQSATIPIHREIIDMICALKDSNLFPGLENVSKTKIRGVLALLKHSELLLTEGDEGEPVRLFFPAFIQYFHDLRKAHDEFLIKYMQENNVYIPMMLKEKIFWYLDDNSLPLEGSLERRLYQQALQQKIDRMIHVTDMMKEFLRTSYRSRNENDPQYAGLTLSLNALQLSSAAGINATNTPRGGGSGDNRSSISSTAHTSSPPGSAREEETASKKSNSSMVAFPPGLMTSQHPSNAADLFETKNIDNSNERPSESSFTKFGDLSIVSAASPVIPVDSSSNTNSSNSLRDSLRASNGPSVGSLIIEPPQASVPSNSVTSGSFSTYTSHSNSSSTLSNLFQPAYPGSSTYETTLAAPASTSRPSLSTYSNNHNQGRQNSWQGAPRENTRPPILQYHKSQLSSVPGDLNDGSKFSSYQSYGNNNNNNHLRNNNNNNNNHYLQQQQSPFSVPAKGNYDNYQRYPPRSTSNFQKFYQTPTPSTYGNQSMQPQQHLPQYEQQIQQQHQTWKDFQSSPLPTPPAKASNFSPAVSSQRFLSYSNPQNNQLNPPIAAPSSSIQSSFSTASSSGSLTTPWENDFYFNSHSNTTTITATNQDSNSNHHSYQDHQSHLFSTASNQSHESSTYHQQSFQSYGGIDDSSNHNTSSTQPTQVQPQQQD